MYIYVYMYLYIYIYIHIYIYRMYSVHMLPIRSIPWAEEIVEKRNHFNRSVLAPITDLRARTRTLARAHAQHAGAHVCCTQHMRS